MPIYQLSESFKNPFEYELVIDPCPKYLLYLPPEERNQIDGNGGNNFISGTDDHDIVYGRLGDDTLLGSAGYDELRGGGGSDWVDYGGSHCAVAVDLESGKGWGGDAHGDTYFGIENIFGSHNDDTLTGDNGENVIRGSSGDDIIDGGRGNDSLFGDAGDDTIVGAAGDDTIYAGNGDNVVTGSAGADLFVLYFAPTTTTITDFGRGQDVVQLIGFYDFEYFMDNAVQNGNDVEFSRDNDYLNYTATLILEDVALSDLEESDFIFN